MTALPGPAPVWPHTEPLTSDGIRDYWAVPGFPDYGVSRDGHVYSAHIGRELTRRKVGNHWAVRIAVGPKRMAQVSVAKLVASTFLPNPEGKPKVHFRDWDADNLQVENLQWATMGEIVRAARAEGRTFRDTTYVGVRFHAPSGRWGARVRLDDGTEVSLRYHDSPEIAARAYNDYVTTYGLDRLLNDIPEPDPAALEEEAPSP